MRFFFDFGSRWVLPKFSGAQGPRGSRGGGDGGCVGRDVIWAMPERKRFFVGDVPSVIIIILDDSFTHLKSRPFHHKASLWFRINIS